MNPSRHNHTRAIRALPPLLAAALILAGCEDGGDAEGEGRAAVATPSEAAFPSVSDTVLAAGPGADWPAHGGDLANQRFSPLDQINRETVAELVPVWIHSTGIEGAFETTPIVVGNTMYLTTARGRVLALNAANGEELWEFEPQLGTVTLCCGPVNRGVAAYGDRVYVATLDARLLALDARTGQPVWEAPLADATAGYSATMAPVAAEGRVFVGVAGERYGIRGFMAAFDADSGEELWRWHTIPDDSVGWWGEWRDVDPFGTPLNRDIPAERADSFNTRGSWTVGGGGIATSPAYDPATDRLFINVEGPSPLAGGAIRPGDNLFTGSIVALDARTGRRIWHAQYLPHDIWGLSGGSPPFLFDRGGDRYVGFAGRTGWVYVFDADNGQPILRSDNFVPQENLFARPEAEGAARVAPGANGGNAGAPVAYAPDNGIVFVGGVHQPMVYSSRSEPYRPGQLWIGGDVRFAPGEDHWGTVSAIDLADGAIVWQRRTPAPVHSGVLATAGNLVFVGQGSGTLDAFDSGSGELLWQFDLGAGVHGGPVTYSVAGVQYLAVPAGGSFHFDTPAGDDLVTFALASQRPATTRSDYPTPRFTRAGPAGPAQPRVRQLPGRDTAAAADTAAGPADTTTTGGAGEPPRPRPSVDSAGGGR